MILAFVSRKGGVGKTTSVVSLAGALVRLGHKVLVVDLDSQASASRMFARGTRTRKTCSGGIATIFCIVSICLVLQP